MILGSAIHTVVDGELRELTPTPNRNGYLRVRDGGDWLMVARLVCEQHHGPPPTPEHQAAHLDGDRTNNHPDNLAWKTPAENAADRIRHGTQAAPTRKLSPLRAGWMRDLRAAGFTIRALASAFGVSERHVQRVVNGHAWGAA